MKLSVVIPAYNAGNYIEAAICSVKGQKSFPKDSEIIVIDDGSKDSTIQIAESLGAKVIMQDHKGAACARNAGLNAAEGDFILLLDADDLLADGAMETFFTPFDSDPDLQAVFSYAQEFFSEDLTEEEKSGLKLKTEPYGGTLPGCSLLKKSVFDQIGLFDGSLHGGETVDWMVRFRSAEIKSIQTDTVTLRRRVHANNTGRLYRKNEMANYAKILRAKIAAGRSDQKRS